MQLAHVCSMATVFALEGGQARFAGDAPGTAGVSAHASHLRLSAGSRRLQLEDDDYEENYSDEDEGEDEGDVEGLTQPTAAVNLSVGVRYELDANKVELESAGVWGGECT